MSTQSSTSEPLAARIYARAHLMGGFRLRSGRTSDEYFDKYLFEGDPPLLREICEAMTALLPDRVDAVAGLVLGGVPLATLISQITGLPTLFVREQAKTYGTCRLAEGGDVAGRRVAVVEDVVSSGGAVMKASTELRRCGADVVAVLCVIDRESGGSATLAAHGLQLQSLFTMTDLRQAAGV
ncbi:MAG TPA: orotate phosphoribosyltransferase [Solirubrobacteraceae bacterium]|nr:orotate phosphoribosyltransferase [Solirubrobacteraceae bacterium]